MGSISHYESRTGRLSCTPDKLFDFVTDFRNFEQFIPPGAVSNWHAEKEQCRFDVPIAGTAAVRIAEKETLRKVVFKGDILKINDLKTIVDINSGTDGTAEVKILLEADLNPVLRVMADKPINQFLEILVREMENFRGWETGIK